MGHRMQPRNEKFTRFSKAGSNVVESAAILVSFLVIGFGDHAADPAGSQVGADRARGGGLVGQNTFGPGARSPEPSPATAAWSFVLSPPRDLPRA